MPLLHFGVYTTILTILTTWLRAKEMDTGAVLLFPEEGTTKDQEY